MAVRLARLVFTACAEARSVCCHSEGMSVVSIGWKMVVSDWLCEVSHCMLSHRLKVSLSWSEG